MALSELPRTTGFRLALLFLVLFGAASLTLFGFLYWQTNRYLTDELDEWMRGEILQLVAASPDERRVRLERHAALDPEGRRPFGLFDAQERRVAGNAANVPARMSPLDLPFEFSQKQDDVLVPFRGLVHRLPTGELVLVSRDVHEMHRFREVLRTTIAWGALLTLVLALAGAAITGAGSIRRIDVVTRAIERIVSGGLTERLPSRGTGGDIDRLIRVINRMLDDIERLMHEVKGVSNDIAHDLRTPLTRLLAGLDRARRRAASVEDYAEAVDGAIVETKAVLTTFTALLRLAEVEDGARRAGFTQIDLATIAADVVEFYEPLAESKGVALSLETSTAGPLQIPGDPSLLFEAIGNLVDNAIKFTPQDGRVIVRCGRAGDWRGVTVTDSGPGIPEAERGAVLQRFYRTEKSRHKPGSGLGLSLVAAIARLHELDLAIEDGIPGCRVTLGTSVR